MADAEGLVVGLATRGRPQLLLTTLSETLSCVSRDDTRVICYVDQDDTVTKEVLTAAQFPPFKGKLLVVVRPRPLTVAEKWNWMMEEEAQCYAVAVDHSSHRTPGFDQIILDAAARFGGGPGVVMGPLANLSFPCLNACTRSWAEAVGYIYPPYFPYWFTDHWFDDVARMTERIELVLVKVDSSRKPFTAELREPAWWANWFDAALGLRVDDALKVLAWPAPRLQLDPAAAEIFRRRGALVTQDSRIVNDSVRAQAHQLSAVQRLSLVDERYLRSKQRAREMLPMLYKRLLPMEQERYRQLLEPQQQTVQSIPQAFKAVVRVDPAEAA